MQNVRLADAAAKMPQRAAPAAITVEDDGFYDIAFVCAYFGGSRPLNAATIYRGIAAGRYPRPVRPSPNTNRWLGRELKESKQAIIDAPREPLVSPRYRGTCAA
jgi:predicted DNA-binding transcriptional regulator AlpA